MFEKLCRKLHKISRIVQSIWRENLPKTGILFFLQMVRARRALPSGRAGRRAPAESGASRASTGRSPQTSLRKRLKIMNWTLVMNSIECFIRVRIFEENVRKFWKMVVKNDTRNTHSDFHFLKIIAKSDKTHQNSASIFSKTDPQAENHRICWKLFC